MSIPILEPVVDEYSKPTKKKRAKTTISLKEKEMSSPTTAAVASTQTVSVDGKMSSVMKGFKEGAMKAAFDKMVDAMAGPLVEKIIPNLKGMGLNVELVEPAVKLAITFAFMLGIAELTAWIAPMASKVIPGQKQEDMAIKGQKLAEWMRRYAGEKVGSQVIDAAVAIFPMIMASFAEFSIDDINASLNQEETSTVKEAQISLE